MKKSRLFIKIVVALSKLFKLNVFVVTDGVSAINNNGNPCCLAHIQFQIDWELKNGYNPFEDWSK